MAKFGLFGTDDEEPIVTYQGDYIRMDKPPFVIIYKYTDPDRGSSEQVAAVHLDKGHSIKPL